MVLTNTFASVAHGGPRKARERQGKGQRKSRETSAGRPRGELRQVARGALTHASDLLLIEDLELLADEFEIPLHLGEEHVLDGSRTALGAHIFAYQPPQVQRAHSGHH